MVFQEQIVSLVDIIHVVIVKGIVKFVAPNIFGNFAVTGLAKRL